ncbi:MAG: SRPBCC domain-containing protein [Actinoplanes sp.]
MTSWTPVVDVDMLIRRPAADAYEAFADPDRIRRFWLASSSGRLEEGALVHWVFKVAGAETDVEVVAAKPGQLLDLRWDGAQPLRITFEDRGDACVVGIRVTDFGGDEPAAVAAESMSGFTLVLASLKQYLEHGVEGDLMYDKFPDAKYADR